MLLTEVPVVDRVYLINDREEFCRLDPFNLITDKFYVNVFLS